MRERRHLAERHLLTDPRGFDDFFSSDLLQESIGWNGGGNNSDFLPAFVDRALIAFHLLDPLIDKFLAGSFAERHPKEKGLRLPVLRSLSRLWRLNRRHHLGLPHGQLVRIRIGAFRTAETGRKQLILEVCVVLFQSIDMLGQSIVFYREGMDRCFDLSMPHLCFVGRLVRHTLDLPAGRHLLFFELLFDGQYAGLKGFLGGRQFRHGLLQLRHAFLLRAERVPDFGLHLHQLIQLLLKFFHFRRGSRGERRSLDGDRGRHALRRHPGRQYVRQPIPRLQPPRALA